MELTVQLEPVRRIELFGMADKNLRAIKAAFDVQITAREDNVILGGDKALVEKAADVIDHMQKRLIKRGRLTDVDVQEMISQTNSNIEPESSHAITVFSNKGIVEPFTKGQLDYIDTMLNHDLTFAIGPAGTGKTYLAVAVAVSMLKKKQIRKIILARPAVEAGEKLGFLPGDIAAKVNPYLRPLFDSLEDMMEFSQMRKFMEMDVIEIIPLAFMRGRTLNEACIICDEAQNTSPAQMLMFLTRMGRGSKMIITGDTTQVDLGRGETSGLMDAIDTLRNIPSIGIVELGKLDIVRHRLVQNIVQAYDNKHHRQDRQGT